jgi:hypothetical protein
VENQAKKYNRGQAHKRRWRDEHNEKTPTPQHKPTGEKEAATAMGGADSGISAQPN